jgi:hypothetical protein
MHRPTRRTKIVWLSFLGATTLVVGVLTLGNRPVHTGYVAASVGRLGDRAPEDPVFQRVQIDESRWTGIVIHDLGAPAGDAESIHRLHLDYGYQGLGYHFLIGNGNGLGDGVVHIGYRWSRQLPGAHTVGPEGDAHNRHSIGICLIGNGERRPFTERQVSTLIRLVRQLQTQLGIPVDQVHLHKDLADGVASPGRYFPASLLEEQLVNGPR